ncbi:Severe Depolymerization of Actin [Malassezia psittaci]|uniref:Protein SDA1 n=1 Tax=Malassezia psittaci TaxID=1821823 RepID=A0AAF0FCS8_9BASI|nr:Severe Depolymerization of Actin [Malassezia psittaci]
MAKADAAARPTAIVRENGLTHRSKARGLLNTSNLPALQNLLKREPSAYAEEFLAQWNHYESLRRIFASGIGQQLEGGNDAGVHTLRLNKDQQEEFQQLLTFVTQLAPSYPKVTAALPEHLSDLLLVHHAQLGPDVRRACFQALTMLRNRGRINSETSSELRKSVLHAIVQDIKQANRHSSDMRLNRMVQGLLFGMVERGMQEDGPVVLRKADTELTGRTEALWAVRVSSEMWRRRIWKDARTVALLASACTHPHPKVQASAVRFFLGDLHAAESSGKNSDEDASEQEAEIPDVSRLQHQRKVGRKSKAGERRLKLAQAQARRRRKEKSEKELEKEEKETSNMAAIHLLHDPQTFADRLYENLSRGDKRHSLEMKVRIIQLLSRVMGTHRVLVLPFYSYLAKYLMPHQLHITLILVSLAQSVHDQTPTDMLTPAIRKIAYAFVHPGVNAEVVAAGINTIREVCRRQPWCMEEDLLHDLVDYRKSKDKGVSAASRGLMQLYREVNPALLRRVDRGKSGAIALAGGKEPARYGVDRNEVHGIQGLDLLAQHLEQNKQGSDQENEDWEGWDLESASDSDSESSTGWINVSSDDDAASHFSMDRSDLDSSDDEQEKSNKNNSERDTRPMHERVREARRRRRAEQEAKAQRAEESSEDETEAEKAQQTPVTSESNEQLMELATSKILTPADFAKMNELRLQQAEEAAKQSGAVGAKARRELAALQSKKRATATATSGTNEVLDEMDILGPRKKAKADYEERMKSIQSGREDRGKFGSSKGKKNKEEYSSTTNRQKARGKNFQMVSKSWGVRSKKNASLREKSKRLRKHITTSKKRVK